MIEVKFSIINEAVNDITCCRLNLVKMHIRMLPKEHVSDYPRPPKVELINGKVSVTIGTEVIAEDTYYIRVCETFHPPTIYINQDAFTIGTLKRASGPVSYCEWKGLADYWTLSKSDGSEVRHRAGWSYPRPSKRFEQLTDWIAVYPRLVDTCLLEGEKAKPQPGSFYGGWVTSWTIGPFKGDPNHPELL